jgi:MFS family permease
MTVLTRYLGAAGAARIADEGARLSLVLLAVDRTGKAAVGGALVAVLLVPHVVAAPLVGVVIDRSARPRWVLAGLVATFAASLFTAAQLLGRAPLGLVVAVLLLGGCCGPAITGGLTSQLPALVGVDRAPRAFGFDSLFYNVAGMAGPALVGLVAAVAGRRPRRALWPCWPVAVRPASRRCRS